MSKHRGSRRTSYWQAVRSTRVRAALCLGIFLGFGSLGTFAYFSDSATVAGATFTSGTLDIEVNGEADDSYAWSAFTLSEMVPGESRAASVQVANVGSVPFTYTASGSGSGALLPALSFKLFAGGVAANGTAANLRTGSCTSSRSARCTP